MINVGNEPHALTHRQLYRGGRLTALLLLALTTVSLLLAAVSCSHEAPIDTVGTPVITFETYSITLEPAHPGDEVYAEFNYRNDGDATLIISEVTAESLSEGC
jgi:hypothetical protein